jgi:hypothetical protein
MSYAEGTSVPVERSRAEIEQLLVRYGADQFISGWGDGRATIGFRAQNRFVRFELRIPDRSDRRFTHKQEKSRYGGRRTIERPRTETQAQNAHQQEIRRLWRALALLVKAKLEAVESGITSFEHEFLAHILMPDGLTVGQHVTPAIGEAYSTGKLPALLPGPGETGR